MPDIFHQFPIVASPPRVFAAVTTPEGLDAWWTLRAAGTPVENSEYELYFGPAYDWRAVVTRCVRDAVFELQLTKADKDWTGSHVGFRLQAKDGVTEVQFQHVGWPEANEHFRVSSFCWAMYLRLLKRYVEQGEVVPYEARLEA